METIFGLSMVFFFVWAFAFGCKMIDSAGQDEPLESGLGWMGEKIPAIGDLYDEYDCYAGNYEFNFTGEIVKRKKVLHYIHMRNVFGRDRDFQSETGFKRWLVDNQLRIVEVGMKVIDEKARVVTKARRVL